MSSVRSVEEKNDHDILEFGEWIKLLYDFVPSREVVHNFVNALLGRESDGARYGRFQLFHLDRNMVYCYRKSPESSCLTPVEIRRTMDGPECSPVYELVSEHLGINYPTSREYPVIAELGEWAFGTAIPASLQESSEVYPPHLEGKVQVGVAVTV